jgi:hypothetical protein
MVLHGDLAMEEPMDLSQDIQRNKRRKTLCLTEMHSRVRVGKNLSDRFPIRNGLKQGDALTPLLFNFV